MSDHARRIVGIEKVNKGTERWTGKDELVAVVDSGIDSTHPDLAGCVASLESVKGAMKVDRVGHGTHVSGTIAGRGTASKGKIRGMAPGAGLVGLGIVAESGGLCLPPDLGELLHQVADKGAKIINLSWGTPVSGAYENGSMAVDTFARERPDVLIVVAAGNQGKAPMGYPTLYSVGTPATAKNVLTVGACASDRRNFDVTWRGYGERRFPVAPTSDQHLAGDPKLPAALSSRGPTDTDSVKPDVLAPGTAILAPRAAKAPASTFWKELNKYDNHYGYMNGTSMATPVVSGAAAVLRQFLREERKLKSPSSALMRAALIASAIRIPWAREPDSETQCGYPDFDQGFGRIDLASLIPHPASPKGHDLGLLDIPAEDADALEARAPEGAVHKAIHIYAFKVLSGAKEPLRIVLAWNDYSARCIQNLLKLDVRGPEGRRWRGNEEHRWLLPPEADLDPDTLDMRCDLRNNVQAVAIEKPPAGEYHVRITAQNTVFPPQGFALCVSGQLEGGLTRES